MLHDKRGEEATAARANREKQARRALELNVRSRAKEFGLRLFKVVHTGKGVFVRAGPSCEHTVVSCRKQNDEVLIAEEREGWVRLSEEDENYPYMGQNKGPSDQARDEREAWMLIDGAELGLGQLLEEQSQPLQLCEVAELQHADHKMSHAQKVQTMRNFCM